MNEVFVRNESKVQSYARSFSAIFNRARGTELWDVQGRRYLDFLAGAGSLNYGHNNPVFKQALLEYIESDAITHSLDLHTAAKEQFLEALQDIILAPRGLDYVVQFSGPTGANAVEAALKLARKVTGRTNVVFFTNGFHGVSLGALAVTGNEYFRRAAGVPLQGATPMPYDGYLGDELDTITYLDRMLADRSSGLDLPAAVIVEVIQGEGGLNTVRAPVAPAFADPVPAEKHRVHRGRNPDGLRPHGYFLRLRAGGDQAGHRHAVEVPVRLWSALLRRADQALARPVEAGRAQWHLPRQQPRLRHRDGHAQTLLADPGVLRGGRRKVGIPAPPSASRWSRALLPTLSR